MRVDMKRWQSGECVVDIIKENPMMQYYVHIYNYNDTEDVFIFTLEDFNEVAKDFSKWYAIEESVLNDYEDVE